MALPTLEEVKSHMNLTGIDDFDTILSIYLDAANYDAENITGRNFSNQSIDTYEVMNPAIKLAVLNRVATSFDSRQDNDEAGQKEAVNASTYTFRQFSKRPMF
ncbi:phage gp6-like head-tail connector protein [Sphingobacterium psychroaquaticum]|uniref:head-tail connector protein n=1 Tax=Sphingobacterium psychroaquaticum TaxID=561061 RepID=UPI00106D0BA2|nr:head-tail connector protein [Sphingobacterium psychroaquaticum]QBQ41077.1 phage gp6-like head-tail connector protein [Sphingobacterium psychroaquaticum]